ncbi:MAG: peptide chain release factor 2 [Bacillota bacterium]
MIIIDEQKMRLKEIAENLKEAGHSLDFDGLKKQLEGVKKIQEDPNLWDDLKKAQQVNKEASILENKINEYVNLVQIKEENELLIEMIEETHDESLFEELVAGMKTLEEKVDEYDIKMMLKGEYDANSAILTLHSGAGGTEACDWTQMLYRMYTRFVERFGFKYQEIDKLPGDEAGLKSVTFKVEGLNAYGYLKAEKGVHRLVRISPFDSNAKRHTSFASLEVVPEIEDEGAIEIRTEDLRVDTYRSGGAGGQHVNTTDSAVRITHMPTGIIVACQNERSQVQNRDMCMKMLRSKLIEKKERDQLETLNNISGSLKKIEWGSQIRSYVFQPYTMVKDHRTGYQSGNISAVMDGDLVDFIYDYLRKS